MIHPGRQRTLLGLLMGYSLFGCRSEARHSTVDFSDANAFDLAALEPAGPEVIGWEESTIDGVTCRHPPVSASCEAGWCRIPAGCFIMGSPETELGRGMYDELLSAVTLSHAFEIGQHEITRRQWSALVSTMPQKPSQVIDLVATCTESNCPVRYVSWFEALRFANLMSEQHAPKLASCYKLEDCQGGLGASMTCATVGITAPTVYDCEGYRLPTEAEWEYAARAGTRTAYYVGDVTYSGDNVIDSSVQDETEPNLEPIAWYDKNSGLATHAVGQKRPNRWMLSDMLGNAGEWTGDRPTYHDLPGPFTDPATEVALDAERPDTRVVKGSNAGGARTWLRAACWDYPGSGAAFYGVGFRLVRTLK